MMQRLALVFAFVPALLARNVYVMPATNGVSREVAIYAADSLTRTGTVQAANDAYKAVTLPNGTKTYILGRGASNTITVVNNATLLVTATVNLPGGSSDAAVSPDGRRLAVVGATNATINIIDTGTDTIQQAISLPGQGVTLAMAFDSSKVYTLVPSTTQVVSVDLFSYALAAVTLPFATTAECGVGLSPNGFLYASAPNRLYEIDPRTFTLNPDSTSLYNGTGGIPQFTPDGLRAVMVILNPAVAQSSATVVELRRSALVGASINLQGVRLDRLQVVSGTAAIAYSISSGSLYSLNILSPYSASPITYSGVPGNGLTSLAVSGEFPNATYSFVSQGNTLYRINNASGAVSTATLDNPSGPVSYAAPASTRPVTQLLAYNGTQLAGPLNTLLPLVVRALDADGFPVAGITINFSSSNIFGVNPSPVAVLTNGSGYAVSYVTNPGLTSRFSILAATPDQITQLFTFVIGTDLGGGGTGGGGGGGATGKIEIWDGNGLFVKSGQPGREMVVRVTDSTNNPVPGATVNWTVTSTGGGSIVNPTSVTNDKGLATNVFVSKFILGSLQSFEAATITATTGVGTVTFSAIQIPQIVIVSPDPNVGVRNAPEPRINQQVPAEFTQPEIVGPIGGVVKGAFKFRIVTNTGPFLNAPIPGVGVQAFTENNDGSRILPEEGPVVSCDPTVLSDADGVLVCDLRFDAKSKLGSADRLIVRVGGLQDFRFSARMTVGPATKIEKALNSFGQDPDNQSGLAGTELPRQLLARVTDAAGNFTTVSDVRWEIISGSATLVGTVSRADARGIVSTGVRLGNTPGQVKIRVSVPSVTTITPLIFTATVNVAFSQMSKISGDNQAATVGTAFSAPLVVRVLDGQQRPVQGALVGFSANGDLQVPASVATDANGQAAASVRAGNTANSYSVTASIGSFTQTFSLVVNPLGPTLRSVTNNASNRADASVAPCALVNINGSSIVPNLTGTRSGGSPIGRLVETLEGVRVRFNGVVAPISSVTGGGGSGLDTVVVQVPCETLPGSANIEVTSGSLAPGSTTVRITPVAPGIYEDLDSNGVRKAIVLRPSGPATAASPAEAGETVRIIATGLGLVSPSTSTNSPGSGNQTALGDIVIGLNNEGITASSTEYASGFVGVYYVAFQIPINTTRGANRPLVIAASGVDGNIVFSAPSAMDIR